MSEHLRAQVMAQPGSTSRLTAAIVSKTILLAEDDKIKDPTILSQITAR
ncbi:MAG: hypothetical protein ACRC2T_16585 [Thermoguttaceae bacterium]